MKKEIDKITKTNKGGGVKRESNLELFRIITMLLIVAHHYVVNSGLMELIYEDMLAPQSIFLLIFGAWGKIGINCFILITGYFMCKSQITMKKFAKLIFEVEFYKIVFYLIFLISGYAEFSLVGFVKAVCPITEVAQNFTGCYLIFFLCIPFLNILISNMSELQHIRLIALLLFVYVILGTIPKIDVVMNYVSWYIVLYFVAAYIRLYPRKIFSNTRVWGWLTTASIGISVFSVIFFAWIGTKFDKKMPFYFVSDSNKILALVTAVCAFIFFKNLKIEYSKFINTVAASTFGVLLIHANSDTMRQWLWKDTLKNTVFFESEWLVLHAIGSVVVIYIVCTVIDVVRIRLIEIPFFKVWDKHWGNFVCWFKNKESCILKKFNIME